MSRHRPHPGRHQRARATLHKNLAAILALLDAGEIEEARACLARAVEATRKNGPPSKPTGSRKRGEMPRSAAGWRIGSFFTTGSKKITVCAIHAARLKPALMANSITPHEARTIAAAAYCDPRSVVKVVRGEPVATLVMARIKNALAQLNRLDLLPATTSAAPSRSG